jgi:hypothetical protein
MQVLLLGLVMAVLIGVVADAPGQAWLGFALAAMCAHAWQLPRRSRG